MFMWFTNPEKYAESFLAKEEVVAIRNKAKTKFTPTAIQNMFYAVILMVYFVMAMTSIAVGYALNYASILFQVNMTVPIWLRIVTVFTVLFTLTLPEMWVFYKAIMPSFMGEK